MTKRDVIIERHNNAGDINLESYDDDGDYISLYYSASVDVDDQTNFEDLIMIADQLNSEIDGALDLALDGGGVALETISDEKELTLKVLVPLIGKLGFSNVKYNHGKREFGKDIVFARLTEFDDYEHYGVQVKQGNVSGGAHSDIDEIIAQIDDAFKMPFYDVYTRRQVRIAKLIVAISGKFTENAVEKICEKNEAHAIRNNVIFLDGDKIETLIERYKMKL